MNADDTSSATKSAQDAKALGRAIHQARKDKGWTLDETSKVTGVGRSTLSKIENNQTQPSFEIVRRVTQALGIDTPQLFLQSTEPNLNGRRDVTLKGDGDVKKTPTYIHELLSGELTTKRMLPYITTITARHVTEFEALPKHEGEEFLYVLSGEIEFHCEHYRPTRLKQGDSLYYDSGMGHGCISISEQDAQILWVSLEQNG